MTNRQGHKMFVVGLVTLCAIFPDAFAQSRVGVNIGGVGSISRVGGSTPVTEFSRYSYGLGALQSPQAGQDHGVLRSSIYSPARYTIKSGYNYAASSGYGLDRVVTGGAMQNRMYAASSGFGMAIPQVSGGRMTLPIMSMSGGEVDRASTEYLQSISMPGELPEQAPQDTTVNSFAPPLDSLYSQLMKQGEDYLHRGEYEEAFREFQNAYDVSPSQAEPLLGMVHARIGMGGNSYSLAALYLSRALKLQPELALANINLRSFFPSEEVFDSRLAQVREFLEAEPYNAESLLVLAYALWFEGRYDDAYAALRRASGSPTEDKLLLSAIEIFSDSMRASGKLISFRTNAPAAAGSATTNQASEKPHPLPPQFESQP